MNGTRFLTQPTLPILKLLAGACAYPLAIAESKA